ncbi:hypothetical protein BUALT_Bualt17G0048500 [Buddleja alternifolia]|uniref:PGG domain-containing protein n=1 Tax=Buddleja alternifolia TaxID=168488 RepID=A0AAV6WFF8_9LAMI|nr:hypothetical protein BUALT_Bualt17G0048500 [Buddleja alternifolia]
MGRRAKRDELAVAMEKDWENNEQTREQHKRSGWTRKHVSVVEMPGSSRKHVGMDETHKDSESIYEDFDLYLAAKTGNVEMFRGHFESLSSTTDQMDILRRRSPKGNTFLHLAAKHGNQNIVEYIAEKSPQLNMLMNSNGDTALHVAARAGHESVVKALLLNIKRRNEAEMKLLLGVANERGNTALHEALINGWESVATYLILEDNEVSHCQNNERESALYLAANAGFAKCVSLIIATTIDEERITDQFTLKSPIQAAIIKKNRDVLQAICDGNRNLAMLSDGEWRTPLHLAAESGYVEGVRYLLGLYPPRAIFRDKDGALPIHLASIKGHVDLVIILLQFFPDPEELLDSYGRNILHLAALNGRSNVVSYILDNPDLEELINMEDTHGDRPLHLATKHWHPKIVNDLTWDKRVDIKLVNDMGMTALDTAEHYMPPYPEYRQRLTWAALRAAGTPRSMSREIRRLQSSEVGSSAETYKERVNTLLLVSTLVATVTFAAGFTMPGGYNSSSDRDPGIATMLRHIAFQMFVLCGAIAMYSSIVVDVVLIWAQLGDRTLILNALTLAEPLIVIALTMMSMAFTAGVYLVVSKLSWLGIVVFVMGAISLALLLLLLLPLCAPLTSSNRVYRYISYCLFCLLIFAATRYPKY